jgi:hypothetical protein
MALNSFLRPNKQSALPPQIKSALYRSPLKLGEIFPRAILFVLLFHRGFKYCSRLPEFSWSKNTKMGKLYKMTTNYAKLS